jgi:hypothetical protein
MDELLLMLLQWVIEGWMVSEIGLNSNREDLQAIHHNRNTEKKGNFKNKK